MQRFTQEQEFLRQMWGLLNPEHTESIPSDVVFDFFSVLMDPFLTGEEALSTLVELTTEIGSSPEPGSWPLGRFISEFKHLHENAIAYKQKGFLKRRVGEELQSERGRALTFHPQIDERSKVLANRDEFTEPTQRHQVLFRKEREKEERLLNARMAAKEAEMNECTFTPVTNKPRPQSQRTHVTERLYELRNNPKMVQDDRTRDEKELEQCTFHPVINKSSVLKPSSVPRDYQNFINGRREAFQKREEQRKRLEHVPRGENYDKVKQLKVKPFSFLQREKEKKSVLLYVDVHVAPGRTGRIAIHENDNPKELAQSFCQVYHLGDEMRATLEQLLVQQLEAHYQS